MHRVIADLLIPGGGPPVRDGTVVLDGDRIDYAGPTATAPPPSGGTTHRVPVVLPGLWDCHVHFAGIRGPVSTQNLMLTPAETAVARSVKDAERVLAAGFTSVREVGGYGIFLAPVIAEGTVRGPTVYSAGRVLSPTAGHSDAHGLPHAWVADPRRTNGMVQVADGVPDCLRAVRQQLRQGAALIKVCASGGVISELDHPDHQQFSDEELAAIVAEAGRAERVVAAHCHGRAGIMAALRAGCRTIEHGSDLDERAAAAMVDAGAVLVPTRTIYEALARSATALTDVSRRKFDDVYQRHLEAISIAHRAGVTIAAGTDLGTSDRGTPTAWGRNGEEFGHLVRAGLSPLEAIDAGTAHAPRTLGDRAPRSGRLAAGFAADVIALSADPLADIAVLADPTRVTHVWKAGELVKDIRTDPTSRGLIA